MIAAVIRFIGFVVFPFLPHGIRTYAAQFAWDECLAAGPDGVKDVATIQCLVPLFKNVVASLLELAGIALFIALVVGGYNYLMSGGNPKQMEQAKNTITYAIIGVVLVVSAYLIILIIGNITGVGTLNQFTIPNAGTP